MSWLFWKNDRTGELAAEIKKLQTQLLEFKGEVTELALGTSDEAQAEQLEEVSGQLTKLARMQYKSGHETQAKLDKLGEQLLQMQDWQVTRSVKEEELASVGKQRDYLLQVLINQLDEIDMACAGFKSEDNDAWYAVLVQWAQRILSTLLEIGIYEMGCVGKSFDPQLAEGVGTIARPVGAEAYIPYEVAEVVKRGFVSAEGILLRKAQVITYMEAEN